MSKPSEHSRPKIEHAPPSAQSFALMEKSLLDCVEGAGKILLRYFGKAINPRLKEAQSSVVCDADLASEDFVCRQIRRHFPGHNIISEECGCVWQGSEFTWVVDPLDGTSNFVAGLPWFGAQIGILQGTRTILAAMFLPMEQRLYWARSGRGATRNGTRIGVTRQRDSRKVLCAFGFDPAPERRGRTEVELLFRVSQAVRNTRATNSLVDFCYTADGRLGACINLKTKIWDIVPISLILPEAGGRFTDLQGNPILFQADQSAPDHEFAVLGASRPLHTALLALTAAR